MRAYGARPDIQKKRNARLALRRALEAKQVGKLPCMVCGAGKVDGHHVSYDMPVDVVWLCREHHQQLHKEAKATGEPQ